MARWIIPIVLLAGCTQQEPINTKPDTPSVQSEASSRRHSLPEGDMIVIDVPIPGVTRASEKQTCYVWRPTNGADSLSCPNDSRTITIDPPEK
jgi:hypothetical protein